MQTSEAPNVGIRFRVFDLNSCRSKLGYHFVEVMHSKVHHPDLVRIPEIVSLFGKGLKTVGPASCSQTGAPSLVGVSVIPKCCWYQFPNALGS